MGGFNSPVTVVEKDTPASTVQSQRWSTSLILFRPNKAAFDKGLNSRANWSMLRPARASSMMPRRGNCVRR